MCKIRGKGNKPLLVTYYVLERVLCTRHVLPHEFLKYTHVIPIWQMGKHLGHVYIDDRKQESRFSPSLLTLETLLFLQIPKD